ncbi:MAG: helix-turn-helix domain-containing protein, partial [Pseudomonadota bacterium]
MSRMSNSGMSLCPQKSLRVSGHGMGGYERARVEPRGSALAQVDDGRLSVGNAANMLCLTRRQIFRLLKRYRQDGASAIRHKARGKPPNNR